MLAFNNCKEKKNRTAWAATPTMAECQFKEKTTKMRKASVFLGTYEVTVALFSGAASVLFVGIQFL